ncbi:hypothetical protein VPJ54_08420, partial [Acinetobacter baumannii]
QIGFFIKNSYIKNILNREELINLNIYEKKFKSSKFVIKLKCCGFSIILAHRCLIFIQLSELPININS